MKRDNHYERAFEAFLRRHGVAYVAVDEARRSQLGDGASLKNLDFLLTTTKGVTWLVDVKGRRFPSGDQTCQYWKNWSTRDDLVSLNRWERLFGDSFHGLFVFAYWVLGQRAPLPPERLFEYRGRLYGFVGVRLCDYARAARIISPKWDTVAMPTRSFRGSARAMDELLGISRGDPRPASALGCPATGAAG